MSRTPGRSGDQTKELILAAAASEIQRRGLGVTLDAIAAAAGISKGGVVYHFASKENLVAAMAHDQVRQFRDAVDAKVRDDDASPGRFTRGYIRAMLDPEQDTAAAWESAGLLWQLMTDPVVRAIGQDAHEALLRDLAADGLTDEVSSLVVAAADGATAPLMWGAAFDAPRSLLLEEQLIQMTQQPSSWSGAGLPRR